ncbi:cation diffusion facilitator family transporter [Halolamina sp. C58]|uniref:cation diffusion facilitator family transporter n=1 Tax=Halolamina sp. C58 TaxID=3421640 RepID=UPI003EB90D98
MGETHNHDEENQSTQKLAIVAGINLVGFVAELAGGLLFGSVALIGDALHMLFDAVAYVLALGAVYIGRRTEPDGRWTYGLNRLEPLAAFLNGVLLVPMVGYLVWESYQRYLHPVEIEPLQTAALAAGGLVLNIVSVYVIQGRSMSLNERGAYYHLLGDTGASVAVIVSMLVIQFTGSKLADPITAVIIAAIIVWSAIELIRESGAIFLQRSPVSVDDVRQRILEIDGVATVEDAHIWELSSTLRVATVHVRDRTTTVDERDALNERISTILASEYDADHVTVDLVSAGTGAERRREH